MSKVKKRSRTVKAPLKKTKKRTVSQAKKWEACLANFSYKFRTPLNAIIGFSEMISDEKAGRINREQREYLKDIIVSAKEMLRLIKNATEHRKRR